MEHGKECRICGDWKEYSQYTKHKNSKDGHDSRCKDCRKAYARANKEKKSAYMKAYKKANKDKFVESDKKYKQKNKDKVAEYQKEYGRIRDKEKKRQYDKAFRQSEKGKEVRYRAKLKRRSNENEVRFTPHKRRTIIERDKWTCQCCGVKVHDDKVNNPTKAHIDHIVPISKGGNSETGNLRVLCRTCNLSKQNKMDDQLQFMFKR